MNDTFRYILAGGLIFLIIILQPVYLEWLGYDAGAVSGENLEAVDSENVVVTTRGGNITPSFESGAAAILTKQNPAESLITIVTPLYTATLTNKSGGSFTNYFLSSENSDELKHLGGYNDGGFFNPNIPVSLIINSEEDCMPCLAEYNDMDDMYTFINQPFTLLNYSNRQDTIFLDSGTIELKYSLNNNDGLALINKIVSFSANKYINEHYYEINDEAFEYSNNLELLWYGGLRPSEEKEDEDIAYGSGIISQAGETEDIQAKDSEKNIGREKYHEARNSKTHFHRIELYQDLIYYCRCTVIFLNHHDP